MAGVYLCDTVGDGTSPSSAYRPAVPTGTEFAVMMLHPPSASACIVSPDNTLTGTGIILLVTGTTWTDLRAQGRSQTVPGNMRNKVDAWCTAHGFAPLPSGAVQWVDAILFVCQQVNPAASLDLSYLGQPE